MLGLKVSMATMLLWVIIVGQGIVIFYQQTVLTSKNINEIPATIRVRDDSYVHPNGPIEEQKQREDAIRRSGQ